MHEKATNKKRPTQAEVARLAEVSQSTVSQVLNNNLAITLPSGTRQRVWDAIQQLGYVPNGAARSLRTRKTYTLASIIPDITNPFYPAVERGIQDVAERHGYDLIVYNTDGIAEKERKCLHSVQRSRVDGVIGVFFHTNAEHLRPLLERNIPVVRLEGRAQELGSWPLDTLYIDSVGGAQTAVGYLIGRGHGRIGMIVGSKGPGPARLLGYRQALTAAGLPVLEGLIQAGDFTEQGGYQAMQALLSLSPQPTAVFAANDLMAMGALVALREAGMAVPEDMAVIGFDDIPAARLMRPSLTTITLFQDKLGRRAAEMLLERLDGSALEGGRCEESPYQLIIRESA